MKQSRRELNLNTALSDPMVRIVMAADRVDPQELAAMLTAVARSLQRSPPPLSERVAQFFCPS